MKHLYLLFFFAHFLTANNSHKSTIVILKGLCSAGKSSICRALIENDSSWKTIDEDHVYIKIFNKAIKKEFPEQFRAIKQAINKCNHFHAIQRKEILFKDKATQNEQEDALRAIEEITTFIDSNPDRESIETQWLDEVKQKVFQKIDKYIARGKNIIVDSWILNQPDVQKLKTITRVFLCMAYAPLLTSVDRVIKRNKEVYQTNNLMNKRLMRSLIESFQNLYTLSLQPMEEHILGTLNLEYFTEYIDKVRTYLKTVQAPSGASPIQKEISQEKLYSYATDTKTLLQNQIMYITIPASYDFVINTMDHTPEYYAQLIKEKVS
jgi:chloramphenicol 3-O-phosphotransferase